MKGCVILSINEMLNWDLLFSNVMLHNFAK